MREMPATQRAGIVIMGFVRGDSRDQGTLFPVALDELVPEEHVCRVIDAFVESLDLAELGFGKARPAGTGRPPYDPADLLKLYLYGYLHQVRSSRRLERECRHRNGLRHAGLEPQTGDEGAGEHDPGRAPRVRLRAPAARPLEPPKTRTPRLRGVLLPLPHRPF